jgi:hypothetical protein
MAMSRRPTWTLTGTTDGRDEAGVSREADAALTGTRPTDATRPAMGRRPT